MKIRETVSPPIARYDPNNNEEDKKRLQEAIREHVNEVTFGLK